MNQHFISVKTAFIPFAFSLALCGASSAAAQSKSPAAAVDSVMLSETCDGDYTVRRYLVERPADSRYSVRYLINLSTLNAALDDNNAELGDLSSFVDKLMSDTLLRVESVDITGYSSPDGPVAFNKQLARGRAQNFKNYVDRKYNLSRHFDVDMSSVAEDWEMCRKLVAQSSMPNRQAVLNILDSKQSSAAKEAALKKMPAAWDYMVAYILPPLRRVEVAIHYDQSDIVEVRRRNTPPAPQPARPIPVVQTYEPAPCPCEYVDEEITGIIVEMPNPDAATRRELRAWGTDMERDARNADRFANHEAHKADKIAHTEMKASKKIAKKEAKAAKKADRAAEKVARKAARR